MEPRIRVAILICEDGKILLVKHLREGREYWLLPGGGLETGETIAQAAVRELQEETSLEIEPGRLLFISESVPPHGERRQVVNIYLAARITGGQLKVAVDDRLKEARWVSLEELENLTFFPSVKAELISLAKGEPMEPKIITPPWAD